MSVQENFKKLISKEESVEKHLRDNQGLQRFLEDFKLLMGLVKDYRAGEYKSIPFKTIAAAVAGVLYAINPIDIIPDSIPILGAIDDVVVLGFCLRIMEKDLEKYRAWKNAQAATSQTESTNV